MKTFDYIWIKNDKLQKDSYADFVGGFCVYDGKVILSLTCDSNFTAWVNGKLAAFGECADYPHYKLYYQTDITEYCEKGENEIKITVWYYGDDSQTYYLGERGLGFEIEENGKTLLKSGKNVLSRRNINYKNGYEKKITLQLGYSFFYDNAVFNDLPYKESDIVGKVTARRRKIAAPKLIGDSPFEIISGKGGYLIDLGKETVGYLSLDIESEKEQVITVIYGEHVVDGKPVRKIGIRDFSAEFNAVKGRNEYLNTFRRLAGRYIYLECEHPLHIFYAGLKIAEYPVKEIGREIKDGFLRKIYDVSVYTLKCCMHYHYEDCPWREQALYTMDSRNQMLCGYYAFEGSEFQRENLIFISKGLRSDGLLPLSFPASIDIPIPFFSLVYFMQIAEYIKYTGDGSILQETGDVLKKIAIAFSGKVDENGLIPSFPYPCWNFYEWSEGSDREWQIESSPEDFRPAQYDLILNCMYVYAMRIADGLLGTETPVEKTIKAIQDTFYDAEKGIYKLSTEGAEYSQLGNSFALLIGLGDKLFAEKIIRGDGMVKITLSMNVFMYDALLSFGDCYKEFIIEDIKRKYKKMLDAGATTFWETEKGASDFDGAGSLCHGWSAIPVYYFNILGIAK